MFPELIKPAGVPQKMWDKYPWARSDYFQECPHPPQVYAVPCSGSKIKPKEHLWHLRLVSFHWGPADPNHLDSWYEWKEDEGVKLTGWVSKDGLPQEITYNEATYRVLFSGSHDLCPECDACD